MGLILSYINTFLSMICGLFLSSFLLRQLGDTDYGIYQTMSSFANYLVLLEFGTGTVLSRNLVASRTRGESKLQAEKNISTIWTIMSALAGLILLVSVVFYCLIPSIYSATLNGEQIILGRNIFVFIVVFLLSSFISQTLNGIALAHEHYTFSSAVSIIKLILRTGLLAALIIGFRQAILIAVVDAILGVAIAIFSYCYCRKAFKVKINFKNFDKMILKASLPLCLAIFLQAIVNQSNNIVGKFILGVMSGPEDVALYSVALYIFGIFSSLSTIPVSMYVPQVTQTVLEGVEGLSLTKTLVQPCRLIVLISGSVLFGFIACGRQFIEIVYGQEYLLAWLMALLLIVPSFLNMSNAVVLNVLDAKNKRIIRSYILMATTALNLVMTIFGIKYFGIIFAAAATGIATLIQVIIMNIYYQKSIGIKVMYLFRNIYKGIVFYQIIGAAVGYAISAFINNVYIAFLVGGIVYVLVSFGGFLLLGKSQKEEDFITKIFEKLKSNKE